MTDLKFCGVFEINLDYRLEVKFKEGLRWFYRVITGNLGYFKLEIISNCAIAKKFEIYSIKHPENVIQNLIRIEFIRG